MGSRRTGAAALAALALLATAARARQAEPAAPERKTSVLVVTAEGWRPDHTKRGGWFRDTAPTIDAFHEQNVSFEKLLAPIASSAPAHASLFTASDSPRHGWTALGIPKAPLADPELKTAAELLAAEGYTCAGFASLDTVGPKSGLGAGLSFLDDPGDEPRDASDVAARASKWLEIQGTKRPFFLWVHFKAGCEPNVPPSPYSQAFPVEPKVLEHLDGLGVEWPRFDNRFNKTLRVRMFFPELQTAASIREADVPPIDRDAFARMYGRYDGDLLATDAAFGALLGKLDELGLAPTTLVVFAGVYGQSLGERMEIGHGELVREQLAITAAFRAPGGAPRKLDELASLVDVLPTAFAAARLPAGDKLSAQADGLNLLPDGEQRDAVLAERATRDQERNSPGRQWALYTPEWKYVRRRDLTDQLYDLRADPGERTNVIREKPDLAEALKATLDTTLAERSRANSKR
jgi:arylsulfatase A-like enzyme